VLDEAIKLEFAPPLSQVKGQWSDTTTEYGYDFWCGFS
jgi:hypothetical protein